MKTRKSCCFSTMIFWRSQVFAPGSCCCQGSRRCRRQRRPMKQAWQNHDDPRWLGKICYLIPMVCHDSSLSLLKQIQLRVTFFRKTRSFLESDYWSYIQKKILFICPSHEKLIVKSPNCSKNYPVFHVPRKSWGLNMVKACQSSIVSWLNPPSWDTATSSIRQVVWFSKEVSWWSRANAAATPG